MKVPVVLAALRAAVLAVDYLDDPGMIEIGALMGPRGFEDLPDIVRFDEPPQVVART
jgi:hypothetical protein